MTTINTLPGGNVLISGEEVVKRATFPSKLTTVYVPTTTVITNKRLVAHFPKIVLGFLPLGFQNITLNLKQISSVKIDIQYAFLRVILGGLCLLLMSLHFLFLFLAIALIMSGVSTYIVISGGGESEYIPVVFWKKAEAQRFVQSLNTTIAEQS